MTLRGGYNCFTGGNRATMTTSGPVRGRASGSVLAFKGIPYARSPVGPLRFAAPVAPLPWSDVLDAGDYGPVAPQPYAPLEALLGAGEMPQSEAGCLTLNVWTPGADDAERPVMVWVHGGAFTTGSGAAPWYDGTALAEAGDVVVVTFNYRLGTLGFMYLGESLGSGGRGSVGAEPVCAGSAGVESASVEEPRCNFGLLDQLAVLSWVHDNAAAFGGDPECVTVFGQSAGAMSIGAMFGSSRLPGLVRRAILQSGACSHTMSVEAAALNSTVILDRLGLTPESPGLLESLQSLPTSAILAAQAAQLPEAVDGMTFLPVLDGLTLTARPLDAVAAGAVSHMDLLVGTNADEARLFMLTDPSLADMDEKELMARASEVWGPHDPERARQVVDVYRRSRPNAPPREVWSAITTDKVFRIPAIRLAEAAVKATGIPDPRAAPIERVCGATFAYLFAWRTPAFGGAFGSCHSLEIPFVFDHLDQAGLSMVTGPVEDLSLLAREMRDAWVAFARSGRPVLAGGQTWPPYVLQQPSPAGFGYRATMCLDITCGMIEDPDDEERRLWEGQA